MKLRHKILSFTLPLTLVPFALMAAAAAYFLMRANRTRMEETQNRRIAETTIAVRQGLENARREVALLAGLPPVRNYLEPLSDLRPARTAEAEAARDILKLFFDRNPYYLRLSLVDSRGQVRLSFSRLPGEKPPLTLADEEWFRRILVMSSAQSPVQELDPGRYVTYLLQTVHGARFAGAVVLSLNTEIFQRSLGPLLTSTELSAFLFDDTGRVFAGTLTGAAEEEALRRIDLAAEAALLLSGPSQQPVWKEFGAYVLTIQPSEAFPRANWEPRAGENWFIGVLRRREALAEETQPLQAVFVVILAGAVVAVVWTARRYARRVTEPLEQVSAATAKIAGGRFDVELNVRPNDEVGELAVAVARMAEDLKDYQAKLVGSARLVTIGEMTSEIAHEIQNRVSGLSLWVQHLDAEIEPGDSRRECLDEIKRGLRGFMELLAGLKEVYRAPILDLHPAALNELVLDSLRCVQEQAARRGIAIETRLQPDLPAVRCDAEKVRGVMINLLTNAVEAVAQGRGLIAIETVLHKHVRGEVVVLAVSDNGCGITEEDLPRIFYPFFSTKGSGSGLGLAIASNIMAAHKGRLTATSRAGEGATFRVEFDV